MEKTRRTNRNSIARMVFVGVALLLQIGWLLVLVFRLNQYSTWISLLTSILSAVVVLVLYSKHTNAAMKMPWIMLIMALPMMGLCLYLLFEAFGDPGNTAKRIQKSRAQMKPWLRQNEAVARQAEEENLAVANHCRYLWDYAGYPLYRNTQVDYYPRASQALEAMKADLEQAQRFIFMEYFIVEEGSAFRELHEILTRKAKQGVEVRLMYDDIGSVGTATWSFARRLNEDGIRCQVFNPALPILNLFMNHRDHRKITVIDGKVGFTGGYNLADEYFDRRQPYGDWKDTGVRLEGEAVRSLTAAFLELWCVQSREQEPDFGKYLDVSHSVPAAGFVQPFADDPLDEERAAENVYMNLIGHAKKTLYFTTPYLIISDEMAGALRMAAKRGVDVRIITPGVPDKKTVFAVTRSYYAGLVRQGVRIYEYSPGFCHAKQCLCDGEIASIGTSNLDYRSLYHHYENNVLLWGNDALKDIQADFEGLFSQCREVTESYRSGQKAVLRLWQCILRLFSPLL